MRKKGAVKRFMREGGLVLAVAGALLLAVYVLSRPYRHEAAWRVPPQYQWIVQVALAGAANSFNTTEDAYRRETRPAFERGDRRAVSRFERAGATPAEAT